MHMGFEVQMLATTLKVMHSSKYSSFGEKKRCNSELNIIEIVINTTVSSGLF